MNRNAPHWPLFFSFIAAAIAGLISNEQFLGHSELIIVYSLVGEVFLSGLKILIIPLVTSSLISSVAGLSGEKSLKDLGLRTITYFLLTSFSAILVGLIVVNLITPAIDSNLEDITPAVSDSTATPEPNCVSKRLNLDSEESNELAEIFCNIIPHNILSEAVDGQLVGIVLFSILFGYFMLQIDPAAVGPIKLFWNAVFETTDRISLLFIRIAPIAIFALLAKAFSTTDFRDLSITYVPLFLGTVIIGLAIHALITLPILMHFLAKTNPYKHYSNISAAILTAFSTSSSSATLPITMKCVEQKAGVSRQISSFVLPLGATINMDGTALFQCVALIFTAQICGLDLSFTQQLFIALLSLLASIGTAAIPGGSFAARTFIANQIGIPIGEIGWLIFADRLLDMFRTSINVISDSTCAVVIDSYYKKEYQIKDDPN